MPQSSRTVIGRGANRGVSGAGRLALKGLVFCVLTLGAEAASAQEVRDFATTWRGRLGDGSSLMAAQDAVDRAGVACRVNDALVRGRDADGATHFEVACGEAAGFVIVDRPGGAAISCLVLDDSQSACRLGGNRDVRQHFSRMADAAGVACVVEAGQLVGTGDAGRLVFEVGCRGPEGFWLEQTADGWSATDCLTVRSEGGRCRLTTEAEEAEAFAAWLGPDALEGCQVDAVRPMGRSVAGAYYEVRCADAANLVARLDSAGRLAEAVPCARAERIGDGCRLGRQ